MNNEQIELFIKLFHYWCGRLKISKPIVIKKDNRITCVCEIDNWIDIKQICLRYNSKIIAKASKPLLISVIFHEISHLINQLPYSTDKEKIKSETTAEKFAFEMTKKYYPKQYKLLIKEYKENNYLENYKTSDIIAYKALKKLKNIWG